METVFWPMISAAFFLAFALGALGISRARRARRFRATLNTYAEKQIAQENRWKTLARTTSPTAREI